MEEALSKTWPQVPREAPSQPEKGFMSVNTRVNLLLCDDRNPLVLNQVSTLLEGGPDNPFRAVLFAMTFQLHSTRSKLPHCAA